ncbi:phosphate propanoyltransferase [Patescibacteria group bacterium]|nr:phosphate propanoyltransferase [Patescibacteria group bacterium]MBU1029501.1 phosphate propanoyltransferase [Patescibacteria group bacterium]MBU1915740.1 phosphate propanoyltransferase [Patescibacteria group bacterium]
MKISIEVSARHVHLSTADLAALFGANYELTKLKDLSQPGQWAAEEKITVRGPRGELECRVLGPCRPASQVELAKTDCLKLGIEPTLRLSGDHEDTPGCTLIGPQGEIEFKRGVIVAKRHIHLSDAEALERNLKNGDSVTVAVRGERAISFHNVILRTHESFRLNLHLDTDEGNAAWQEVGGGHGEIIP